MLFLFVALQWCVQRAFRSWWGLPSLCKKTSCPMKIAVSWWQLLEEAGPRVQWSGHLMVIKQSLDCGQINPSAQFSDNFLSLLDQQDFPSVAIFQSNKHV